MSYPQHGHEFHERLLAGDATDGDHASRPDPEDVAEGHLYACSDHGLVYQSDGVSTWATWFDPSTGAPGAHNHSGADITSGTVADARIDAAVARDTEITAAIAAVIASAPGALDTLDELAAALTDDANFASTMTTALAGKQPLNAANLSAIAALTTTAFGRSVLESADAAAVRTLIGLVIGTDVRAQGAGDPVGGTPAVVLAAAAAAGSSPNFLRRDDTIAAFDATAPVTQAFSDAAAAGSAAFAARRDHVHGMPASPGGGLGAGFFGDGSDGAVTLTQASAAPAWASKSGAGATTTFLLNRDVLFTTLDLDDSGGNFLVRTGGFRIFANVSLTIDAGVTVHNDGNAASGATAGTNASAGSMSAALGAGSAGGVGVAATQATAVANSAATVLASATAHGGTGGASTGGGTGGGVAGGTAQRAATGSAPASLAHAYMMVTSFAFTKWSGGGGGTGGNATALSTGGGGGAGGSTLAIYAKLLTNNGVIRAQGGAGGNGAIGTGTGAGGGAGGGGGAIVLVIGGGSTTGTLTVTGGVGGALAGTGATGGTGVSGQTYILVLS